MRVANTLYPIGRPVRANITLYPIGSMSTYIHKFFNVLSCSTAHMGSMTPEQVQAWRWEKELDERNRPLSDDELDALFPLV